MLKKIVKGVLWLLPDSEKSEWVTYNKGHILTDAVDE